MHQGYVIARLERNVERQVSDADARTLQITEYRDRFAKLVSYSADLAYSFSVIGVRPV
jgi:hypothetical protein